jgi:hypothetical protein
LGRASVGRVAGFWAIAWIADTVKARRRRPGLNMVRCYVLCGIAARNS